MKKALFLSALALSFAACKQESKPAPDAPLETPADTTKQDTVALVSADDRLLAMNEVSASENALARISEMQQGPKYESFGKKISADKALSSADMLKKYKSLKPGDSVDVKFASKVTSVCKKKGCWMKVTLPEGKEAFVRFKDYEFFVPLNADNSNAIVSGKAFVEEISVDEQRHYAKDGGKSQEEINKISQPKITYAFTADGVLLQK